MAVVKNFYVVQYNSGATTFKQYSESSLLAALDNGDIDGTKVTDVVPGVDTSSWGDSVVIVKGDLTKLRAETTVTKYKIIDEEPAQLEV